MLDAGMCSICDLVNTAEQGNMPIYALREVVNVYFEERTVGYNRYYAALGVNQQIAMVIRTWRLPVKIGQYAVLSMSENDGQYRITNVQQLLNDDGLKCTDMTLERVENNYDVTTET